MFLLQRNALRARLLILMAKTKGMLEEILTDIQKADPEWNVILLRYFNPIGAHESGTIGENLTEFLIILCHI